MKGLTHRARQVDDGLLDHWLVLTLPPLHDTEGRHRNTPALPLADRLGEVFHRSQKPGFSSGNEHSSRVPEAVAVCGIESARQSGPALVAKGVVLRGEGSLILASEPQSLELLLYAASEELLRLNLGNLHVAVRVSVEEELRTDELRKEMPTLLVLLRELPQHFILLHAISKLIEILHEIVEFRDELNETLWQEDRAVVLPGFGSLQDHVDNLLRHLLEAQGVLRNLLT
mmetsp:Transcript_20396/g.44452  ORF Transcript_20396/g.44452 Transcript_20396/m.44452 type:complete len:229 (-) Transcript_20396:887-1573(-)